MNSGLITPLVWQSESSDSSSLPRRRHLRRLLHPKAESGSAPVAPHFPAEAESESIALPIQLDDCQLDSGDANRGIATDFDAPPCWTWPFSQIEVARQILASAIQQYHGPEGYAEDLVKAAWQLEQIGIESWGALKELVRTGSADVELFLGAVVRLPGVSARDRFCVLRLVAKNPDPNVRSRLVELLDEMPRETQLELLKLLTADDAPDDAVTDRAKEILQEFSE